jgi:hypothetical protein
MRAHLTGFILQTDFYTSPHQKTQASLEADEFATKKGEEEEA